MSLKLETGTDTGEKSTPVPADWSTLPSDLPVPTDDGLADHLRGNQPRVVLPTGVSLRATSTPSSLSRDDGGTVDLHELSFEAPVVVFIYPRTGRPGEANPPGWDAIPGARGCTPELCCIRDALDAFKTIRTGGVRIVALSTQSTAYQSEVAQRLGLPYPILSDETGVFWKALRLPTFEAEGMVLLKRVTLLLYEGEVVGRDYPVFPTNQAARRALDLVASVFGNN